MYLLCGGLCMAALVPAQKQSSRPLVDELRRVTEPLIDEFDGYSYRLEAAASEGEVHVGFRRRSDTAFDLEVRSPWLGLVLTRSSERTVLVVPAHKIAFVGTGEVSAADSLAPLGALKRFFGSRAALAGAARAQLLSAVRGLEKNEDGWSVDPETSVCLDPQLVVRSTAKDGLIKGVRRLALSFVDQAPEAFEVELDGIRKVDVDRAELERMISRALRRLVETYVPALAPAEQVKARKIAHGEVRLIKGQRLALLEGSPEQIGRAHGELLGDLVRQTVDSCLYLVGFLETVREGKWFPAELDDAWRRLSPHIPPRHVAELDALADAVPDLTRRELRMANVFPEYFHCSGFAVFGKATKDGTLYHGRVLDYMMMIGLQHAAVTFVVRPDRGYGFLNVGYAGFTGCVTGLNERQISLGEMGGRGRYLWDGVPMATLMRRALEECSTLEQVRKLWRDSPRTCEYYYVIADGRERSATAVSATPDKIEFLSPGESHPRLGEGIEDVVVMSAGGRLRELRKRIIEQHGRIGLDEAIHLMDRPVAMRSNLHNALMVPAKGIAWVAHAGSDKPAAEMRYLQFSLPELLGELDSRRSVSTFPVRDSIVAGQGATADARQLLEALTYSPTEFGVRCEQRQIGTRGTWHSLVMFPSPKPSARPQNDRVVLEWYPAKGSDRDAVRPAMLVMHILDGRMRVARSIATAFANRGVHAFVMHMPEYGQRATGRRRDAKSFLVNAQQAVADARRAYDAIAALPGVDPGAIGIQGTSLGGFIAALASSVDGCFDQSFLMLAGGGLVDMFRNGRRDTAKIRAAMLAAGLSSEAIDGMVRAIDPLRLAHRLDPRSTWLYSAVADTVVPAANARLLGEAAKLGAEHHLWYPGNHYTVVLQLPRVFEHMIGRMESLATAGAPQQR